MCCVHLVLCPSAEIIHLKNPVFYIGALQYGKQQVFAYTTLRHQFCDTRNIGLYTRRKVNRASKVGTMSKPHAAANQAKLQLPQQNCSSCSHALLSYTLQHEVLSTPTAVMCRATKHFRQPQLGWGICSSAGAAAAWLGQLQLYYSSTWTYYKYNIFLCKLACDNTDQVPLQCFNDKGNQMHTRQLKIHLNVLCT